MIQLLHSCFFCQKSFMRLGCKKPCYAKKLYLLFGRIKKMFTFASLCENSSVGRAQPCQGWGRGFESRFSLSFFKIHFFVCTPLIRGFFYPYFRNISFLF